MEASADWIRLVADRARLKTQTCTSNGADTPAPGRTGFHILSFTIFLFVSFFRFHSPPVDRVTNNREPYGCAVRDDRQDGKASAPKTWFGVGGSLGFESLLSLSFSHLKNEREKGTEKKRKKTTRISSHECYLKRKMARGMYHMMVVVVVGLFTPAWTRLYLFTPTLRSTWVNQSKRSIIDNDLNTHWCDLVPSTVLIFSISSPSRVVVALRKTFGMIKSLLPSSLRRICWSWAWSWYSLFFLPLYSLTHVQK